MRKFDTKVQYLKYKVLREVARQAWNDTLLDNGHVHSAGAGSPAMPRPSTAVSTRSVPS